MHLPFVGDVRSGLAAIIPGFVLATAAIFGVSAITEPVLQALTDRHADMTGRRGKN